MEVVKIYRSTGNVYHVIPLDGEVCEKVQIFVEGLGKSVDGYGLEYLTLDGVPVQSATEENHRVKIVAAWPCSGTEPVIRFGREVRK